MAYLTEGWPSGPNGPWHEREWIPELGRATWRERDKECPLRRSWTHREGPTPANLVELSQLPLEERLQHLWALGSDVGSVQRDGLLYANLLEQLKNAVGEDEIANDAAADDIAVRTRAWRLSSGQMPSDVGGPPQPASPLPWRKMMDWLLSRLRDVGNFLLKVVDVFWALVKDIAGATSISISVNVGVMPTLGTSFNPGETNAWEELKKFLSRISDELGSAVFD